jgi:hypothetical protein
MMSPDPVTSEPPPAASRSLVILALVCLHLSAVLYVLLGVGFRVLFTHIGRGDPQFDRDAGLIGTGIVLLCVTLAVGIEVVAYGIRKRRFWAWIVGLIIFGIYLPSVFFPLGALGLWGLLARGSRMEFGLVRDAWDR